MRLTITEPLPVTAVYERNAISSGKKLETGEAHLTYESQGWYLRLGHFSLFVGAERPDVTEGQKAYLTLEIK